MRAELGKLRIESLRLAGSDTAENFGRHTVARNIEEPEFWCESIQSLKQLLARLEILLPEILPTVLDNA